MLMKRREVWPVVCWAWGIKGALDATNTVCLHGGNTLATGVTIEGGWDVPHSRLFSKDMQCRSVFLCKCHCFLLYTSC